MGLGKAKPKIERKIKEVESRKNDRVSEIAVTKSEFRYFTILSCAMVVLAAVIGFIGGVKSNYMLALENSDSEDQYVIDGYKITFLPGNQSEMEGNYGFTYPFVSDDIYISKGLGLEQVRETCHHELMHNLGIGADHHEFVEENDKAVRSDVCRKLVELLREERRGVSR